MWGLGHIRLGLPRFGIIGSWVIFRAVSTPLNSILSILHGTLVDLCERSNDLIQAICTQHAERRERCADHLHRGGRLRAALAVETGAAKPKDRGSGGLRLHACRPHGKRYPDTTCLGLGMVEKGPIDRHIYIYYSSQYSSPI